MPDSTDQSSPEPTADPRERQAAEKRRLVAAYKRVWNTPSGQLVLNDLKQRFGWERWECDNTADAEQIARRCAAKGPIFHIEAMLRTVFRQGKPARRANPTEP